MPRETARDRGRRLVAEGRLVIRRVNDVEILAICRGDSGQIHELGYHPKGGLVVQLPGSDAMRSLGRLAARDHRAGWISDPRR